jgi:hypothetical protein
VPNPQLRLITTASNDAVEHALFDYASKHTEPIRISAYFRLNTNAFSRLPADLRLRQVRPKLGAVWYGTSKRNNHRSQAETDLGFEREPALLPGGQRPLQRSVQRLPGFPGSAREMKQTIKHDSGL